MEGSLLDSGLALPLFIYTARVCDVSLGTLRIMYTTRGHRPLASLLGFFEILIWLVAISQIFQNLTSWPCYLAYAGGYTTGIYMGILIESKMALGLEIVRVITRHDAIGLVQELKAAGYGVTVVTGEGAAGPVKVLFSLIKRRDLRDFIERVHRCNPQAVFSVEDVRMVEQAVLRQPPPDLRFWQRFKLERKGK